MKQDPKSQSNLSTARLRPSVPPGTSQKGHFAKYVEKYGSNPPRTSTTKAEPNLNQTKVKVPMAIDLCVLLPARQDMTPRAIIIIIRGGAKSNPMTTTAAPHPLPRPTSKKLHQRSRRREQP